MAKMEQIPLLGRMRGKVGDLVVKRYRDKYVVTAMPVPPDKRSEKQKAQSQRFADAMRWARHATRDSPTKELYDRAVQDTDRAANTAAVSDYLRPPVVRKVDLGDYAGQKGAKLSIRVENLVAVWRVAVYILDGDDAGDATADDPGDATADDPADATADDPDGTDKTDITTASYSRSLHKRALELGLASPAGEVGKEGEWSYTSKADVPNGDAGLIVVIMATDHPGNMVEQRIVLPK